MLVDPATKAVEADLAKVRAAEQAAYRAKYGKLTPALHERLQTAPDNERLPLTIWQASDLTAWAAPFVSWGLDLPCEGA